MFEKPKKLEEKNGPEQMAKFAGKFAEKESKLNIPPKKAGAFVLLTFLALSGIMGGEAEAKVRVGSQSLKGQQMAGEIMGQMSSGFGRALDRQEYARRMRAEREHFAKMQEFNNFELKLHEEYMRRSSQIKQDDQLAVTKVEEWYRMEKGRLAMVNRELQQEYERTLRPSTKHQILRGVAQVGVNRY